MKFFIDTEFLNLGWSMPIVPISIGIVAEDGREYYSEYSGGLYSGLYEVPEWVRENVFPSLVHFNKRCDCKNVYVKRRSQVQRGPTCPYKTWLQIRTEIREFIGDGTPELWGYYAGFDYVVLSQTFGEMQDWPEGWPMYLLDLKQRLWHLGFENEELPQQESGEHNALNDARWLRLASLYVSEIVSGGRDEGRVREIESQMRAC